MAGKKKLARRVLWLIIILLALLNVLTIIFALNDGKEDIYVETVATIGEEKITRQQWLNEIESNYGEQILKEMVDEKVVRQLAEKYKIKIDDDEIERELTMMRAIYNPVTQQHLENKLLREQVEISLLYEELLTKDAVISDEEMKIYYSQNKDLYNIPDTYHLSHITVKDLSDAEQVIMELENGSSFIALAQEKSLDDFSASRGGELGYAAEGSEYLPSIYLETAKTLDNGEYSKPIRVESGYAVILLNEFIQGVSFSYGEVKEQIRRQIATDQMNHSQAVQSLWKEANVSWFYGSEQ